MSDAISTTDVVIIGSGPVGLFAIFECGMMNLSCHVVDTLSHVGGQCAALYPEKPIYDIPAWPVISGQQLIDNLVAQAAPFKPVYHLSQQVLSLIKDPDTGIFTLTTSNNTIIKAKAIIIAAGVGAFGPNRPPLDNISAFEGQEQGSGVAYMVRRTEAYRDKTIVIAGGGDSAVDWAVALAGIAQHIYVVHRRAKFRAAPDMVSQMEKLAASGAVELVTPYQLEGLEGDSATGHLTGVRVATLEGQVRVLPADALLAFFGLSMNLGPITEWGLGLDKTHLSVNVATQETTTPGIFAIGDIATYPGKLKLILTGFSEAARAAHSCFEVINPGVAYHFEYSTTKGPPGSP